MFYIEISCLGDYSSLFDCIESDKSSTERKRKAAKTTRISKPVMPVEQWVLYKLVLSKRSISIVGDMDISWFFTLHLLVAI